MEAPKLNSPVMSVPEGVHMSCCGKIAGKHETIKPVHSTTLCQIWWQHSECRRPVGLVRDMESHELDQLGALRHF
jgi:hypothetical protein